MSRRAAGRSCLKSAQKDATTCWRVNQRRQGRSLRSVCVRGGHMRVESTCRRDTSDTSGQPFATEQGKSRLPYIYFSFFIYLGIVRVCVCEASSLV